MQRSYDLEMKPALVGMLGDLTCKTTDSYLAEAPVCPGVPVALGTNPAKQVAALTADNADKFVGIAMHEHKELTHPYYPEGYCVPVVTKGRVWVKVEGEVEAGKAAFFDADNCVWTAATGIELDVKFRTNAIQGLAMVEIL